MTLGPRDGPPSSSSSSSSPEEVARRASSFSRLTASAAATAQSPASTSATPCKPGPSSCSLQPTEDMSWNIGSVSLKLNGLRSLGGCASLSGGVGLAASVLARESSESSLFALERARLGEPRRGEGIVDDLGRPLPTLWPSESSASGDRGGASSRVRRSAAAPSASKRFKAAVGSSSPAHTRHAAPLVALPTSGLRHRAQTGSLLRECDASETSHAKPLHGDQSAMATGPDLSEATKSATLHLP